MKIDIASLSPNENRPYLHLHPIVKLLLENGNQLDKSGGLKPNEYGFDSNKDGWICYLQYPINFNLIKEVFNFPPSIHLLENKDSIFCELSWISIKGPSK